MMLNGFISFPPSEIVLPLAGLLVLRTDVSMVEVIGAASLGNLVGTFVLYLLGRLLSIEKLAHLKSLTGLFFKGALVQLLQIFIGRISSLRFVIKLRRSPQIKKLLLNVIPKRKFVEIALRELSGKKAYWIGIFRCLPYVRSIISVPAGIAKMPILVFIFYSIIGITLWAILWTSFGYIAGYSWIKYGTLTSLGTLLLIVIVFLILRKIAHKVLVEMKQD